MPDLMSFFERVLNRIEVKSWNYFVSQEMQRTDTYYKEEQFQGFISEGQIPLYLIPNDFISLIISPVALTVSRFFFAVFYNVNLFLSVGVHLVVYNFIAAFSLCNSQVTMCPSHQTLLKARASLYLCHTPNTKTITKTHRAWDACGNLPQKKNRIQTPTVSRLVASQHKS